MTSYNFHFPYALMLLVRVLMSLIKLCLDLITVLRRWTPCEGKMSSFVGLISFYSVQHAIFNFCGIEIACYMGLFHRKAPAVPRLIITPLAFAFVAFVVSSSFDAMLNRHVVSLLILTEPDMTVPAVLNQSEP